MIPERDSYNIPIGSVVQAVYCSKLAQGTVVDSRVKYGGKIQYTLSLHHPLEFAWSGSDKQYGAIILVENTDIVEIVSKHESDL